ncbi:hypothetical protein SAMN05428944_1259 [Streptomyces sp. 1222.5]|nr:hypothetical protein BX260_6835 [Streptomyces sp. 5112.2]SEB76871.1 hypothetical protein SAMN05428944_1259 [Streptomyces sp. 1222.5]
MAGAYRLCVACGYDMAGRRLVVAVRDGLARLLAPARRGAVTGPHRYTSMCEPMMTVRSRGRPKYSAASAVM